MVSSYFGNKLFLAKNASRVTNHNLSKLFAAQLKFHTSPFIPWYAADHTSLKSNKFTYRFE